MILYMLIYTCSKRHLEKNQAWKNHPVRNYQIEENIIEIITIYCGIVTKNTNLHFTSSSSKSSFCCHLGTTQHKSENHVNLLSIFIISFSDFLSLLCHIWKRLSNSLHSRLSNERGRQRMFFLKIFFPLSFLFSTPQSIRDIIFLL